MPVKNTFVNIAPPREALRRLGTTAGRLEGNRGADDDDGGSTAASSDGEEEDEWGAVSQAPLRGGLDRLSTEALRESLLVVLEPEGGEVDAAPVYQVEPAFTWGHAEGVPVKNTFVDIAPQRAPLRRLSTTPGRVEATEGVDSESDTSCSDAGGAGEQPPAPPPTPAERSRMRPRFAEPLAELVCTGRAADHHAPARGALDRLSTEALQEGLLEGGMAPGICHEFAGPLAELVCTGHAADHHAPARGALDRLSTEALQEGLLEEGMAPGICREFVEPHMEDLVCPDRAADHHAPARGALGRLSTEALQEGLLEEGGSAPGACHELPGAAQGPHLLQPAGMPWCTLLPVMPMASAAAMPGCPAPCPGPPAPLVFGWPPAGLEEQPAAAGGSTPSSEPAEGADAGDGVSCFTFNAPASKLTTRDRAIVLEPFEIPLGGERLPFRVKITAKQVHDRKFGQCFQTSRGHGLLELKCEGEPPKSSEPVSVRFVVGRGSSAEARGPVTHNFLHNSIAKLPADAADWDFTAFVDHATMTIPIRVEVADPNPPP